MDRKAVGRQDDPRLSRRPSWAGTPGEVYRSADVFRNMRGDGARKVPHRNNVTTIGFQSFQESYSARTAGRRSSYYPIMNVTTGGEQKSRLSIIIVAGVIVVPHDTMP